MKLEHLHLPQKGCEAREPTFLGGVCLWPTWPGGCIQLSGGGAAKLEFGGLVTEECLEVCSGILILCKRLLLWFICCIANIDPECIVH